MCIYNFPSVSKANWSVIFFFIVSLSIFSISDIAGVVKITGEVLFCLNLQQFKLDGTLFVKTLE